MATLSIDDLPAALPTPGEVAALLREVDQIEAWEEQAVSDALRALLLDRRRAIGAELGNLLLDWRRAGGTVQLTSPGAPPRPELVVPVVPQVVEAVVREVAPVEAPAPVEVARVVEPPRPPPARPAAPPASTEALAGLKARIESGAAFPTPQQQDTDWPTILDQIVRDLVPAKDPEADLEAVVRVVDAVDRWYGLPPDPQRALAAHLAARLRVLQEAAFPDDRRVGHAFGVISAFMKKARPGFVSGLSRMHRPARESWEADADAFYDRLVEAMPLPLDETPSLQRRLDALEALIREIDAAPAEARSAVEAQVRREIGGLLAAGVSSRNPRLVRVAGPLAALLEGSEFRTLRRAIREDRESEEESEDAAPSPLPAGWAWWTHTRGKRAVMVGGSPREVNRARLEKAFELAELDWMPAEFRRNSLQAIRDRVRSGGVDLVLILRSFVGHDADQVILPACREAGVAWASVEQGYGVARVRGAIERYLDPSG